MTSIGIAFLDDFVREVHSPYFRCIPIEDGIADVPGCLIWKKANDNPAILPFADVATKLSRTSYHMFINK